MVFTPVIYTALMATVWLSSYCQAKDVVLNETKLDCGMRRLALDYARALQNDPDVLRQVHDALRLEEICNDEYNEEKEPTLYSSNIAQTPQRRLPAHVHPPLHFCSNLNSTCIYVATPESLHTQDGKPFLEDGSITTPWTSIHDALEHSRMLRCGKSEGHDNTIILRNGIHSLQGRTLRLTEQDSGLSLIGYPGEEAWLSGGIALSSVKFEPTGGQERFAEVRIGRSQGTFVGDLTDLLAGHSLPHLPSLFTTERRYVRARYPNADPEIDQWGYASPNRLNYSLSAELVVQWVRPPSKVAPPTFTFVDLQHGALPPGVPRKNNSAQQAYNWYASGKGGVCSKVWGLDVESYWCSNASSGGWAYVDRECALAGKLQIPIGMQYNLSSQLFPRFHTNSMVGGIVHAWHSQSWAMHMFEISEQDQEWPPIGVLNFAVGGGRQGGRNWCRCDQCTYAGRWCGQHQAKPWHDQRLISGTWMVENVKEELDQPGEYFLDRTNLLLYVQPNKTLDLVDFRLSLLEEIIDLRGTHDITIENVGFRDTAATYHPKSDWSPPSGGDWSLHRGGAILVENATNVTIRNCAFRRLDGSAVFLSRRTRNVTIDGNRFEWLGENAIATWGDTDAYDATAGDYPMYTVIQNNVMRELGIYQKQSSAVGQAKAALTTIRNNIMFNMPRAAINFNDMVGGGDIVEGNLIFNTCRESGDHGPINTWDRQPFLTTLRHGVTKSFDPLARTIQDNFIIANYGASQGVDNDDGSSWYHIRRNVFYSAEGFKMDYGGHDSVFEDNLVLAYPYDGSQCFNMGTFLEGHGDMLRRNRCLIGLGRKRESGCGDPTCADPRPADEESRQLVGSLWCECAACHVTLSSNEYYTPSGEAQIKCGDKTHSLDEIQKVHGLEEGSTHQKLPDEETILVWAASMLKPDISLEARVAKG